ncbi:hypothetical protein G9A89_006400 [Geosiphon pyriformis]|nr:hypothetical protein G9A89_006400 [Geosiphon pyriformis]
MPSDTFKIKMALLSFLFQLLSGCIWFKSVSQDVVKLFCMKFTSQESLIGATKVAIGGEVFLTTLKIAQSSGVASLQHSKKETKNLCNNKFKVATTPNTAILEYYQSIYTHCKQRFNIPDGIEVVKKSVYQYIENCINNYFFGNYNILEVKSNLYNNLVHYSQLGTEELNSKTLATYFQELNFNIIEYCEEKYPVQSKYSFNFESETETSNKGKQKVKQYSRTTLNTPTLQKTTAKHLLENFQSPRNPTQQQEPISTSANIIDYLQENESNHSESLESEETESEPEEITENEEEMATAYIAKIPEFTGEDNNTSSQKWLDKVQKAGDANAIPYFLQGTAEEWFENLEEPFENWQAFKDAFLQQFTDNNTSITFRNCFRNIKQKTSETFIAGLKDKLIKKVCPQASADLATAIRHVKSYKIAIEEANHTKLLKATSQTNNNSNNNHKDINPHNAAIKTILDHHPTTNLKIVIIVEFQDTGNEIVGNYKETNKTGVINVTLHHNNLITNLHHQSIIHQDHKIKTVTIHQLHNQCSNNISNLYQFSHIRHHSLNNIKYQQEDWFNITNLHPKINCRQRPNHYHTQFSYLTIPEESDFQQTALSEDEVAALRSNSSNHTIPPAQIAQNANLLDIFPFEFEANKSSFLLSNAAVNEQKAITAMYTEATVEGKPICLILNSGLAGSIITYQLMQQLKRNVDRPAQTVIVIADGMKKTSVGEIDNFPFTIDGITISVKVLVIDAPQYQALVGNDWLLKANANLNWETQELKISYQGQYTIIPATCEKAPVFEFEKEKEMPLIETYIALGLPSNWAEETEQEIFEESRGWKKKLSSMGACISPEEEYETCTCYFCKACHRERFGSPKRSEKWDKTPCLTCGEMLPKEYNWINIAMRGEVCDQTCQYALSISEKVRRGTLFDATYNSALNKFYHYPYDAEIIFDLAMALINRATQEDVHQMKEAEYIEYIIELAGFDYKDEQINIQLCEECIMPFDDQWCLECYALSIPLPDENDENEIELGIAKLREKLPTISIYLLEKQPPLQLKYFNNHGQGIRPEKAHEIDAGYDLRYPGKDTLVL